jgi:hypothetical protein
MTALPGFEPALDDEYETSGRVAATRAWLRAEMVERCRWADADAVSALRSEREIGDWLEDWVPISEPRSWRWDAYQIAKRMLDGEVTP